MQPGTLRAHELTDGPSTHRRLAAGRLSAQPLELGLARLGEVKNRLSLILRRKPEVVKNAPTRRAIVSGVRDPLSTHSLISLMNAREPP